MHVFYLICTLLMGNFVFCSTEIACTFVVQILERKRLGVLSVLKDEGIVASVTMKHWSIYHTEHLNNSTHFTIHN